MVLRISVIGISNSINSICVVQTAPRNYWIRVRGMADCAVKKAHQVAVLHYAGAPDVDPSEPTDWDSSIRGGIVSMTLSGAKSLVLFYCNYLVFQSSVPALVARVNYYLKNPIFYIFPKMQNTNNCYDRAVRFSGD